MDSTQPTSFIPKQSPSVPPAYQTRSVSIVMLGGVVIFILTLALSVGVFLYKGLVANGIESKKASLERARAAFDPALIKELERLDKRLNISRTLLTNHLALSALFDTLEAATSKNVRYNSFDWNSNGVEQTLLMRGEAKSYASIAFQSDLFARTDVVKNPVFSNLTLDQRGNVVFTLAASVDPEALRYSTILKKAATPAPSQEKPVSPAQTQ